MGWSGVRGWVERWLEGRVTGGLMEWVVRCVNRVYETAPTRGAMMARLVGSKGMGGVDKG